MRVISFLVIGGDTDEEGVAEKSSNRGIGEGQIHLILSTGMSMDVPYMALCTCTDVVSDTDLSFAFSLLQVYQNLLQLRKRKGYLCPIFLYPFVSVDKVDLICHNFAVDFFISH